MQRIRHRGMLEQPCEAWRSAGVPRMIGPLAWFDRQGANHGFVQYLGAKGYKASDAGPRGEGLQAVAFSRVDPPAGIDDMTTDPDASSRAHDGEYDGWGCSVV
ncbi:MULTISPECIES: ribonuclease E inhibitor RraB [Dyella]|uniref:Regulator of ribonuclease activity B domain-containing protein n=3 Tax=Dyella TaxID=231454 RepID=A0A4R0YX82_9GAMM|nr:hypothetical protein EYV96_10495 [Dyella terrae]TCI11864.1 hypothetical protein EZM97_00375 [Dyella soli]